MKKFLEKNFINAVIIVIVMLILLGSGLTFYNKGVMENALTVKRQSQEVMRESENMFLNIRHMDISARGYALIQDESLLYWSVEAAQQLNKSTFRRLDSLFVLQNYEGPKNYRRVQEGLDTYVNMYAEMVSLLKAGNTEEYIKILKQDFGKTFYEVYFKFSQDLSAYEAELEQEATLEYQAAVFRNSVVQALLFVIGLPTLVFLIFKLNKQEVTRKSLLLNLDDNNRKFLFDAGNDRSEDAKEILENSILNLQKASDFVNQISEGNYQVQWEGLNKENSSLNEHNLAGRLLQMREQMRKVKEEDERRLWVTDGLANFSDIIRSHQDNLEDLANKCLSFLVKYLSAQQGSIFIIHGEEQHDKHLKLVACYAFDRKKHIEKRIEIGQGVVGQIFLEAEACMLTDIPQNYVHITSGLGESTPGCLLIVPMKYNDEVRAVIEIASFREYAPFEISFVEKAGEFIASAIATAQNNERTQHLLTQFKEQTEELKSQEEEMRQNMEELTATQEEMRRKEQELEKRLTGNKASSEG